MKFTYLRYIGDNNLPFQHRDYIDNPSPKYDQYTSEIKSDLSIPEQIIEVFYNTTFIEKCKLWLFEQYKEHYIFNYFTDYEDFLTYDALRYADEYEEGYDEKVKHIMMRIFFFYATFGDSLSQASQTFVPQVLVGSQNNQQQVKKLLTRLSVMATAIGIMNTNVARFKMQCQSWKRQ